jgi:glucokinase
MSDARYILGIDLGGTNIKALCVSPSGQIIAQKFSPTGDDSSGGFIENVRSLTSTILRERGEPAAVGLAAPGLAAQDARSIAFMPGRLHGIENLNWTTVLKTRQSVVVLNDAHAALLGEVWQGAAIGARNAAMLTLGTGVGGAIFSDGKLMTGQIGRGGHLGHLSLDPNGAPDITGTPGSLEDAIGNSTLAARSGGVFKSTRELVEASNRGDARAREIWLRSVRALAAGVASLINILDPQVFVIGGGIAKAGPALFTPLAEFLDKMEWRPADHRVPIVPAKLGETAGALGAAYYAMQNTRIE